jgi:hypothetical protein
MEMSVKRKRNENGIAAIAKDIKPPPTANKALLGHAKLDTTALYTQVATNVIRAVMSPLDRLTPLTAKRSEPPA